MLEKSKTAPSNGETTRPSSKDALPAKNSASAQCSSEIGAGRGGSYGRADCCKREPKEGCCRTDSRARGHPHGDPGPRVRDAHQRCEHEARSGRRCRCSHTKGHGSNAGPRCHECSTDYGREYATATDTLPAYDSGQGIQCAAWRDSWECGRCSRPSGVKHEPERHGQHGSVSMLSCHFVGIYLEDHHQGQRWCWTCRAQRCHKAQAAGAPFKELAISIGEVGGQEDTANACCTFQRECPRLGTPYICRARTARERTPRHPDLSACVAFRRRRRGPGESGDTTGGSGTRRSPAGLTAGRPQCDNGARWPQLPYNGATDSEASFAQVGVLLCGAWTVRLFSLAALQTMLWDKWLTYIGEGGELRATHLCLFLMLQFCGGDCLWVDFIIAGQRGGWDPMWIPGHVPAASLPLIPCTDFPPVTGWPPFVSDGGSCADGTVEVASKDPILDHTMNRQALEACFAEIPAYNLFPGRVLCPCAWQLAEGSDYAPAMGWLRSPRAGSCADGAVELQYAWHLQCQLVLRKLSYMKPFLYWWDFFSAPCLKDSECSTCLPPATGWLCPTAESCADGAVEIAGDNCYKAAGTCNLSLSKSYGDGQCEFPLGQACILLFIWDDTPYTLAGGHKFHLYRQSMLPRLCVLTNFSDLCPSMPETNTALLDFDLFGWDPSLGDDPMAGHCSSCLEIKEMPLGRLHCCVCCLPHASVHCRSCGQRGGLRYISEGHVPSESCIQLRGMVPDSDSADSNAWSPLDRRSWATFAAVQNLRPWLEECIFHGLYFVGLLCFWAASEFQCLFSTMALIGIVYCFKLWTYALSLKGGRHNCDPLLRASRALSRGCPLHLGAGLRNFSPRLSNIHFPRKAVQRSRMRYSRDFIWLVFLMWLCVSQAKAAQGQRFSSQPTWYPAPDTTHGYTYGPRGLEQQRQAARNVDSSSDEDSPADAESEESEPEGSSPPSSSLSSVDKADRQTCIFKVVGFGHRPEFFCQSCRIGVSLERCLELMDVDLQIRSTSGNGVVLPLRGAAITNELHTMWQPTWISYALGKLIAIDATLIGLELFPIYSFSGAMTVNEIRRLLPVLQDKER